MLYRVHTTYECTHAITDGAQNKLIDAVRYIDEGLVIRTGLTWVIIEETKIDFTWAQQMKDCPSFLTSPPKLPYSFSI